MALLLGHGRQDGETRPSHKALFFIYPVTISIVSCWTNFYVVSWLWSNKRIFRNKSVLRVICLLLYYYYYTTLRAFRWPWPFLRDKWVFTKWECQCHTQPPNWRASVPHFVRHLDLLKSIFLEALSKFLKRLVISTIRTSTNAYPISAKFIENFLRSHNCHIILICNAYKVVCI